MTSRRGRLLGALMLLFVPACRYSTSVGPTPDNFQKLRAEQSEQEVLSLLGEPTDTSVAGDVRTSIWSRGGLRITVTFRGGKVTRHEATLDGLPLVTEVAKAPLEEPPTERIVAEEESPNPAASPPKKRRPASQDDRSERSVQFPDIFERSKHFHVHALSDVASEGSTSGKGEVDTNSESGILIGMVVFSEERREVGKFITGIQPIWRTAKRTVRGKVLGVRGRFVSELTGKGGFAVHAINIIRDKDRFYGMSLDFLEIYGDKLDENSDFTSIWGGGKGTELDNYDAYVTSRDYPIYGVECCFAGNHAKLGNFRPMTGIKIYIARGLNER